MNVIYMQRHTKVILPLKTKNMKCVRINCAPPRDNKQRLNRSNLKLDSLQGECIPATAT